MGTMNAGNTSGPGKLASIDGDVSLVGDFVSYDKGNKIRQWIEDIDAIDHINSRTSMLGAEFQSVISSEESRYGRIDGTTARGSDTETVNVKVIDQDPLFGEDDFDLEDDFFFEAAHSALDKGRIAFAVNEYKAADALLREALTMMKDLARKQQAPADTWELRRILGVCAFHVHTPAEAEDALLSVLQNAPKNAILNETQRLQVSETAHLLAQVYVKLGKVDKAYRYCEYALRGRRRVLGKNHQESYESLALMARILELQDNKLRAEFFVDMIPADERDLYAKRYAELALPSEIPPIEPEIPRKSHHRTASGTTPPPSLRRVISSGGSPPKIPERSPSRGYSGTPPRSRSGTLQNASNLRTVSVISGAVSAVSTEPGDAPSGRPSVSPLQTPQVGSGPTSGTMVLPSKISGLGIHDEVAPGPATDRDLLPSQQKAAPKKPDPVRTLSGQSGKSSNTTANGPSGTLSRTPDSPGTRELLPQPLKPQRLSYVSELPGDTHFANGSSPTLPEALQPSPSYQDVISSSQLGVLSPPPPPPSDPPLTALPAIPLSSNIQDRSLSAPAVPQQIAESSAPPPQYQHYKSPTLPHPADRQSIASSSYSESPSTPQSRSTAEFKGAAIGPDAASEFRNAKQQDHKRKISLLSKLRKNVSSSEIPRKESINYNGVRLSKQDVDSIKNDWLTDDVIDFWQEYLEHEMLNRSPKYVLMRPVRTSLLLKELENPVSLKAVLPDFANTLHVMMPLKSPKSSHCSLLLISAHDGLACHYDPKQPRNGKLAALVSKHISAYLGKELTFLDVPDTPEQLKDQDCGVFTCFFMQHLITKINTTHVSQKVDAGLKFRMDAKSGRKAILEAVKARKKSLAALEE